MAVNIANWWNQIFKPGIYSKKIEYKILNETYVVERGNVHIVKLIGNYTADEVRDGLIGSKILGKEIVAIEMFAVDNQSNKTIGLLVKE